MAIKMAQKEAKGGTIVRGDLDACPPEENVEEDAERRQMMEEAKEKGLTCRTCDQFFASLEAQQAHFKGEWHLFNLQRMLVDQARVDETTFTALRAESLLQQSEEGEDEDDAEYGNASSDSSSEDDEDGAAGNQARRNRPEKGPRMRVTTSDGRVISFWRAILPSRDLEDGYFSLTASQEQGSPQLQEVVRGLGDATSRVWVYLMCSGGYFAGSVFDGNKVVAHKTYRRYTVRRKQGGSQSSRDAQGNKPKSAGAFMRRYHEAQLQREIRELLAKWKPYFDASALVFYYLPGGGINRHMFFYEGSPLGTKKGRGRGANPKLRSIPFPIERPSVTAIQKAHEILSTIEIEDEQQHDPVVEPVLLQAITPARPAPETDATSGPVDHRPLAHSQEGRSNDERKEEEQRAEAEIIDAVRANDARLVEELFERIADTDLLIGAGSSDLTPLYVACELANADLVNLLLKKGQPINTRIPGYHYWTVLHRASADGNIKLLNLLLANGADPTIRGLISKTPYDLAPNKETRNAFRRFAGDNPTLWDYDEAKVPPLTKEMEVEGRKKELEKKKKRKDALKARKAREREEEEARKRQQDERRKAKKRREQEERERKRQAEEEERERKRVAQLEEDEADEELQRAIQLSLTLGTSTDAATTPTPTPATSTTPTLTKTTAPPATASSTPSSSSSSSSSTSTAKASGGPECDLCHKRMGEKAVPFYRLSFKYCSTKCVQEHRKQLGR